MKICKRMIVLVLILPLFFGCHAKEKGRTSDNEKLKVKYQAVADALNKQCPVMIGDGVQLDLVTYISESTMLQYSYTLTANKKGDNTAEEWKSIEDMTRNILIEEFKTKKGIEEFRKDNLQLGFLYKDNDGEELFKIILASDEY